MAKGRYLLVAIQVCGMLLSFEQDICLRLAQLLKLGDIVIASMDNGYLSLVLAVRRHMFPLTVVPRLLLIF